MYKVLDSEGNLMRSFSKYREAVSYKFTYGNSGWIIINK